MLVNCKSCGKEIAKGVKKCVNCGADQRNFLGRHKIITGIFALMIIGGIGSAMGDEGKSSPTQAPATTTAPAPATTATTVQQPKADPMIVTADKLVADLKGNPLNASETYKGKYIEVTGQLASVDSDGKYFSISPMNDDFSFTNILCNITPEQKATVSKFTSKQKLTITGTMTNVGEILGYTMKVESVK